MHRREAGNSNLLVEQFLVQTLKPGDVVILNNLGSQKAKAVRQAIRAIGARRLRRWSGS